ncbi:MAG: M6 family metalloprotease domain-containing protein, partial [Candidatus Delongbacteria bacterium]
MKKFTVIITTVLITLLNAAYLENIPILVTQPDGSDINCFSTGDEFFNRLHDKDNYTIIQGNDGWYYYGTRKGDDVVPSPYRVGEADPGETGLEKGAKISENLYRSRVLSFNDYDRPKGKDAPTTGVINNIVIFIRFADEEESIFNSQRSYYDEFFNKPEGPSLGHYFNEVSYQQLDVISHYYPHVEDFSTNLSYQDINPRGYYQPYNETSNPIGYSGGDNGSERTEREHSLLERAVLAVKDQIPTDINIDSDGDGYVDNIVFLISGAPGSWASLLWPHRWALYTRDITINRKRVFDYNFNMTGTTNYFTVGVISHEFFHTLGAPDLYHYYDDTAPDAVGPWDIMNRTSDPPQYMGAWMKYKYGHWIDAPVTIDQPGEYTLQPLQSQTGNMFMIPSPNSLGEFFLVEYRKQSGLYETGLPGDEDGMLIYRIDASYDGNAQGPPDEVYIFRPGGTVTSNGILNNAQFSSGTERTEFNFSTDPYPFLSDGGEGGINITNIGTAGETITFSLGLNVLGPKDVTASINYEGIELNWNEPDSLKEKEISHYILYRDGGLLTEEVYQTTFTDISVEPGNTYSYSVAAYY